MKCKICASDFAGDAAATLCPSCLQKLGRPGTGSYAKITMLAPGTAAAKAAAAPRRAPARERWCYTGDLTFPLAASAHPGGGAVVLDQPGGFRVLHLGADGGRVGVLFELPPDALNDPQGLCVTADGSLYVADAGNDRVAAWGADGQLRQALYGLARPVDVQVDDEGFVYVAEAFGPRVRKFSPEGLGCLELTDAGGWGRLDEPVALAVDAAGNLYVADRARGLLVQYSGEGLPLRCWPGRGRVPAAFEALRDVAVGPDGSIWVGDRDNARVHRFAAAGGLLGVLERAAEPDVAFEGGTFALLEDGVVIPDRCNDRVVCLTFGG